MDVSTRDKQNFTRCIECLNFSSALGYHKTGSLIVALNVIGISEGKENFTPPI